MKVRGTVVTDQGPPAIGPYCQGVTYQNLLFTSGCIALLPDGSLKAKTLAEQSEQVMKNLKAVLKAGGSSLGQTLKVTVYMKDLENFAEFNEIYAKHFKGLQVPARSCVEVARLPKDVLVELDAIAIRSAGEEDREAFMAAKKEKKAAKKLAKKQKKIVY